MIIAVVPASVLAAHPTHSLAAKDYLVPEHQLQQYERWAHNQIKKGRSGLRRAKEHRARVRAFQAKHGITETRDGTY